MQINTLRTCIISQKHLDVRQFNCTVQCCMYMYSISLFRQRVMKIIIIIIIIIIYKFV